MSMNHVPVASEPPVTGQELHFYEGSGMEARQALEGLAQACLGRGLQAGLWRSMDQDEVWLLVVQGGGLDAAAPAGTRRWRFEAVP